MVFSLSFKRLSISCFALSFLHGCTALQYNEPRDDLNSFLRDYEAVVFSVEGASFLSKKLMRWCEPVSVYLPPTLPQETRQSAHSTIEWLSAVDGLSIYVSSDSEHASVVVNAPATAEARNQIVDQTFPSNRRARRQMKNSTCFFEYRTDADNCIVSGTIVVPTYHSQELQTHCMAEELVQVMGLPNDASFGPVSIFSPGSRARTASARDRLMVQLHYNSSLKPGMTSDEALQTARPLVDGLVDKLPVLDQ